MDKHHPIIVLQYIRREYFFDEIKRSDTFTRIIHQKDFVENSSQKTIRKYFRQKNYEAEYVRGYLPNDKKEPYKPPRWIIHRFEGWGCSSVFRCFIIDIKFLVLETQEVQC